jgi:hypothetical protein
VLLGVLCFSASAGAQAVNLDVAAGHTTYAGVRTEIDGPNAMIALTIDDGSAVWGYGAVGTPLDGLSLPWLAFGAGGHPALGFGRGSVGADLGAHGYAYEDRAAGENGRGGFVYALPSLGINTTAASFDVYSGVMHHETRSSYGDSSATAHDSGMRLTLGGVPGFAVEGDVRRLSVRDAAHNYAGGRVRYSHGTVTGWVSAGRWLGEPDDDVAFGGGGSVRLRPGTVVNLAYQRESGDPFFETTPRRSWTVGIRHRLGARRPQSGAGALVRPGSLQLRVAVADAPDGLLVAGDFNGWQPVPMHRDGQYWSLHQVLDAGVYRYAFRRSDGSWFVPAAGHRRIDDGMGGETGVVVVP